MTKILRFRKKCGKLNLQKKTIYEKRDKNERKGTGIFRCQKAGRTCKKQAEKDKLLIDLGLSEKEYSPSGNLSDEYPEYDRETKSYYKLKAIAVTDEEFEEIKRAAGKRANNTSSNEIATILTGIAWITYAAGFMAGLALFEMLEWYILLIWLAAFLSGTVYLGFAEIIKLLTQIRDK